jgi:hypothetical protein
LNKEKINMTIDYNQLKLFVEDAMAVDGPGGMMTPSAPAGVPHRMPAADTADKEQDMGDPEANALYDIALAAREATEKLIVDLDDPVYDQVYEDAFKASACLRRVLNGIIDMGAHPMPDQRVVAPPRAQQQFNSSEYSGKNAGNFTGGMGGFAMPMGNPVGQFQEGDVPEEDALKGLGVKNVVEVQKALAAMSVLDEEDKQKVIQAMNMQITEAEEEEDASSPASTRAKRIAAVSGGGEVQSAEAIEQSLLSVLSGAGTTPVKLRDALASIFKKLQIPSDKAIANTIVRNLEKQKKA